MHILYWLFEYFDFILQCIVFIFSLPFSILFYWVLFCFVFRARRTKITLNTKKKFTSLTTKKNQMYICLRFVCLLLLFFFFILSLIVLRFLYTYFHVYMFFLLFVCMYIKVSGQTNCRWIMFATVCLLVFVVAFNIRINKVRF